MVESATATEGFLLDLRRTMSECLADNHYGTMHRLAHENGAMVMSEDVNPATAVDGMEYYKYTDWAGGEFWVRAAQNWKPNDIRDGVAGARIYDKKIVFAEAWTGGSWQDHPFAIKAMGDHNYTEGLNRMMLHVWNEQHHPGRAPGIPGAGTPFNYLNTWWKAGQGWRDYMKKAQALLQQGQPTEDGLYFTGENIPCRSLLKPSQGSCWYADPALPDGYTHDTINRDGLLRVAKVVDGRIVVSGLSYRLLVLKADEPYLTPEVADRIKELVAAGATVVGPRPQWSPSNERGAAGQEAVRQAAQQLWGNIDGKTVTENHFGKGRVFWGKPMAEVLRAIGAAPDVLFANLVETATGKPVVVNASSPKGTNPVLVGAERKGWGMEFCHRQGAGWDLYFLSNQEFFPVSCDASFRVAGKVPELWYADTGRIEEAPVWRAQNGRTVVPMTFDPAGSVFVLFRKPDSGADPVVGQRRQDRPAFTEDRGGPGDMGRGGRGVDAEDAFGQDGFGSCGRGAGGSAGRGRLERDLPGKGRTPAVGIAGRVLDQPCRRRREVLFRHRDVPQADHDPGVADGGRPAPVPGSRRRGEPGAGPAERQGSGRALEGALRCGHHRGGGGRTQPRGTGGDQYLDQPADGRCRQAGSRADHVCGGGPRRWPRRTGTGRDAASRRPSGSGAGRHGGEGGFGGVGDKAFPV